MASAPLVNVVRRERDSFTFFSLRLLFLPSICAEASRPANARVRFLSMTLDAPIAELQAPAAVEAEDQAAATTAKTAMNASVPAAADDAADASAASASASAAAAPNPLLTEAAPPPPLPPPPPPPPRPAAEARPFAASNQGEKETAVRWASLLSSARAEAQAAFLLKRVGACPRCCLRFAGVRDAAAYAPPAPSSAALLAELTGSEEEEEEEEQEEEKGESSEEGGGPPCPVCLGVLQSAEPSFRLPLPSERMATAAASMDMGAGAWTAAEGGTGERVAAVVERQGHSRPPSAPACSSAPPPPCSPRVVSLQVSFPASVGLRQAAASAALAAAGLPAAKPSSSGPGSLGPDSITDVKDAVKAAVAPSLSRALGGGARITTANDDQASLTVSLQFVHPATAREVGLFPALVGGKRSRQGGKGSVFVAGGGGDGQGCWKKRKRVPAADCAAMGRAASQALMAGSGRLDARALAAAGFPVPPTPAAPAAHLLVRARAAPLLVGGRYLKLLRDVSQSPFFDDKGNRRGRTSVQEEIERVVLPLFGGGGHRQGQGQGQGREAGQASEAGALGDEGGGGCDGCKFITAGREDLDVRCLGKGRPFVLEIANARLRGGGPPSQGALDGAREKLKESRCGVELDALAIVGRAELVAIKEGETSKQKSYEAVCWLPCEVDDAVIESINGAVRRAEEEEGEEERERGAGAGAGEGKGLVLKQTTPARVEHRRAMLVRLRSIHQLTASRVPGEPQQVLLRLRTQAGLYVKEFVHGDGGRTVPSLLDVAGLRDKLKEKESSLPSASGDKADTAAALSDDAEETESAKCLSLDVCEIHLDFL